MGTQSVLKDVENFLRKDLAGEVLTTRTKNKRSVLLNKVTECLAQLKEQDKLDEFLSKQREVSRLQSSETERSKSLTKINSDEDDGDYYMDLTEINTAPGDDGRMISPSTESCGSGSGYESYASDEDTSARTKSGKEENLALYFSPEECDVFSYIYIENKNKFLKGKKWVRRVGIVKENHLKWYKKPSDSAAMLDIPLRAYGASYRKGERSSSIIIVLSTPSDAEAHKFSVDRYDVDDWSKVLREKAASFTGGDIVPPPPVAARPLSTLPRSSSQAAINGVHHPIQRTSSVGVADRAKSVGDVTLVFNDSTSSPPPVPPGHPTYTQSTTQFNNIGKGIKSAMTDMFKKDKTKKKISTAENLGANACGHLMVFDNKWIKKWCLVKGNQLLVYGKEESPDIEIELHGCDLRAYSDDPERQFGFKILRDGKEIIYLEANSSEDMGKWIGVLIAETGCAEMPENEPEYMPIDVRNRVNTAAKQAFKSRKDTFKRKSKRQSTFYDPAEGEELYLDLDAANQVTPQNITPQKIVSPPLPPSSGRLSVGQTSAPDLSLLKGNDRNKSPKKTTKPDVLNGDKKSKSKGPKTDDTKTRKDSDKASSESKKSRQKTTENAEVNAEKGPSDVKKSKTKKKDKQKRQLKSLDISAPTDKAALEIQAAKDEMSSDKNGDATSAGKDTGKTVVESIIEKRRKELTSQKTDIKTKLHTLSVKRDNLNKYIEAAETDKERGRMRVMLQRVDDEYSKLEKEDVGLELEIRKLNDKSYSVESPANVRPPPRRVKKPINTGATGNVMSRAKMWEAGQN